MADFAVNVYLDPTRFEVALDEIKGATRAGADNGSQGAAEFIQEEMKALLAENPHPRSEPSLTRPWRGPPGMLTDTDQAGHLRDSVTIPPTLIRGTSKVAATAVYARIQEFGGFTGTNHTTYIPPRPYFRPTVMSLSTWGELERIYYEAWRKDMLEAVAHLKTSAPGVGGFTAHLRRSGG
jgi:phage gpG-like protein